MAPVFTQLQHLYPHHKIGWKQFKSPSGGKETEFPQRMGTATHGDISGLMVCLSG